MYLAPLLDPPVLSIPVFSASSLPYGLRIIFSPHSIIQGTCICFRYFHFVACEVFPFELSFLDLPVFGRIMSLSFGLHL